MALRSKGQLVLRKKRSLFPRVVSEYSLEERHEINQEDYREFSAVICAELYTLLWLFKTAHAYEFGIEAL